MAKADFDSLLKKKKDRIMEKMTKTRTRKSTTAGAKTTQTQHTAPANMALRDYLAAQAMHAFITVVPQMDPVLVACDAYAFADSMLAVRDRPPMDMTAGDDTDTDTDTQTETET